MDDVSSGAKCGVCGIVTALIVIAILLMTGFDTLEPTEYGLTYNKISKNFNKDYVYEGGRHWVWFFNSFIEFPATQQTIEFSDANVANSAPLKTRTREGLALTLHVSFQYQLIKDLIPKLYDMYNLQYEQTFIRIARDIILQEAGNYNATEYWTHRKEIGGKMESLLNSAFLSAYAQCQGIQLLKVGLPPTFEQSIVDTQVEVQKTQMKQFEQQAEISRQTIRVKSSEADEMILIIDASARSTAIYLKEIARASIWKETLGMESFIYREVLDQLGFSSEQLEKYQYYQALLAQNNKTLLVDIQNPIIQIST